jgi:hypothetical protein
MISAVPPSRTIFSGHGLHDRRPCRRDLENLAFGNGRFGNGQQ